MNAVLFLFVVPGLIYKASGQRETYSLIGAGVFFASVMFFSYQAYCYGIEIEDMEGRPTRYGAMSAGDKEFFYFLSKPIAFLIQLFLAGLLSVTLSNLYF